jgi:L,D-peptidoglycan transpeptidase YkuD (ErfK/YbiS/YcfS/YnhG family)
MARARVAKQIREKRANLTRENMTTKAKRREWERHKACGVNKTNAVFYRVFQSEIIQYSTTIICSRIGRHEGRTKAGQEVDRACPEQVYRMRNMDMVSR